MPSHSPANFPYTRPFSSPSSCSCRLSQVPAYHTLDVPAGQADNNKTQQHSTVLVQWTPPKAPGGSGECSARCPRCLSCQCLVPPATDFLCGEGAGEGGDPCRRTIAMSGATRSIDSSSTAMGYNAVQQKCNEFQTNKNFPLFIEMGGGAGRLQFLRISRNARNIRNPPRPCCGWWAKISNFIFLLSRWRWTIIA